MIWKAKKPADPELVIKTRFAIFPKRIGDYKVWLQKYYITYDWVGGGIYGWYSPTLYVTKEEAELHVNFKQELVVK